MKFSEHKYFGKLPNSITRLADRIRYEVYDVPNSFSYVMGPNGSGLFWNGDERQWQVDYSDDPDLAGALLDEIALHIASELNQHLDAPERFSPDTKLVRISVELEDLMCDCAMKEDLSIEEVVELVRLIRRDLTGSYERTPAEAKIP